jgi:hypothetical protein
MNVTESWAQIDRTLFAPRRLSRLESLVLVFRGAIIRVRARMIRGRCEARLLALAASRPVAPVLYPVQAISKTAPSSPATSSKRGS